MFVFPIPIWVDSKHQEIPYQLLASQFCCVNHRHSPFLVSKSGLKNKNKINPSNSLRVMFNKYDHIIANPCANFI